MIKQGIPLDMFTRILAVYDFPVTVGPHGIGGPGGVLIGSNPHRTFKPIVSIRVKKPPPPPDTFGLSVIFGSGANDAP